MQLDRNWNDSEFEQKIAFPRETVLELTKLYASKGDDELYNFLLTLQRDLYWKGQLGVQLEIKKVLNI